MAAVAVAGLVAALVLGACGADPDDSVAADRGGGDGGTPTEAPPDITVPAELEDLTGQDEVTITVVDNAFEPRNVRISAGTTVTWVNEGMNNHNVTPAIDGAFEAVTGEELVPDALPARTFDEAGEYPYYCSFHGTATVGQTGFLLVE
jgi:plastocyanin